LQRMNQEDFLKDDFLKELISKSPLDSPSDDFVETVMGRIQPGLQPEPVKRPFILWLRTAWPYALGAVLLLVFLFSSDIPFTDYIPGKGYFIKTLYPYFVSFFKGFKDLLGYSKYAPIGLMVVVAGSLIFIFDRLLQRRQTLQQHNVLL
jgi:hypothetical protein